MRLSNTEENYLKAIFKLSADQPHVSTNAIAAELVTSAASVTDMIKKLSEKKLVLYEKYRGVGLSKSGRKIAVDLIRKHRLWEYFLVETLGFDWVEVHDIAEQMEHIHSPELTNRLNRFLGQPTYDPHGDPIPDEQGNFAERSNLLLKDAKVGDKVRVVGIKDSNNKFLQYLNKISISLGSRIEVLEYYEFDNSLSVKINDEVTLSISNMVTGNLYVEEI